MYAEFFGLKHEPFSIAPDPRYLYMSERHREALAHLLYGLGGAGGGFVLLTGEIGAGKTTVGRCFLEQIPPRCNVAYIFNPKLTVHELLRTVCDEYRIPYRHQGPGSETVKDYIDPLNTFLLATHGVGQNNVLIIDEAQNLSAEVLEQLRLLTNLETNERKLLQIILIGQPELREMLARRDMQQLAQRVVARFHLPALSEKETARYIRHRLTVAGATGPVPFDQPALRRIHQLSRGVPRRINLLCDRALLGAYAEGETRVGRKIVDKAAGEVFSPGEGGEGVRPVTGRAGWLALGALGGAVVAAGVVLALQAYLPRDGQVAAAAASGAPPRAAGSLAASGPSAEAGAAGDAGPVAAASAASPAASPAVGPLAAESGSASASASAAAAPASAATAAELAPLIESEDEAWRRLGAAWALALPPGDADPCREALRRQAGCFRSSAGLALIRQLDRPGILSLRDGTGRPVFALLEGLGPQQALLRGADGLRTIALSALAASWTGGYATFWRTPAGYDGMLGEGSTGPAVDALVAQLARLDGATPPTGRQNFGPALRARVRAFQRAQGLESDGLAGPATFMQLNRATGVDEPRLRALE